MQIVHILYFFVLNSLRAEKLFGELKESLYFYGVSIKRSLTFLLLLKEISECGGY